MNEIAKSILYTKRCKLTALTASDFEQFVNLVINPDVRRFLGGPVAEQTIRTKFFAMLVPGETARYLAYSRKK